MMPFLQGVQTGLLLAIMLGPIFFTLIQAGVERGFRSGLMVGLGVWVSDALFIVTVFTGVTFLQKITNWSGFEYTFGIAGSIILIGVGIGTLCTQPPKLEIPPEGDVKQQISLKTYINLWAKGFFINTINPFTFFFWLSVMGFVMLGDEYERDYAITFFTGVIITIIITDTIKVLLAKYIRTYLRQKHLVWMRRISGIALIAFGIALLVKVFFL